MMMTMLNENNNKYRAHIFIHLTPGTQEGLSVQLEESAKLCFPQQVLAVVWLHHRHPNLLQDYLELELVTWREVES